MHVPSESERQRFHRIAQAVISELPGFTEPWDIVGDQRNAEYHLKVWRDPVVQLVLDSDKADDRIESEIRAALYDNELDAAEVEHGPESRWRRLTDSAILTMAEVKAYLRSPDKARGGVVMFSGPGTIYFKHRFDGDWTDTFTLAEGA